MLGIIACGFKPPEERLSEIKINEESYKLLSPCEQINIFAEIGSEYVYIDHWVVLMTDWVYQEIQSNPIDINSECIEQELSKNFLILEQPNIEKSKGFYKHTSLKIHSLFYLSEVLGILKDPNINFLLKNTVCEQKIQYSQRIFLKYYFTQKDDLPDYINNSNPENLYENMEKLRTETCENS